MTSSEFVPEPLPRGLTDATTHPHRPRFSWSIFWSYTGPGWLMSMAYLDPGNLEADLQSGAYTRYQLLYVVLLSTMFGGLYQILAARLGACTGRHLAQLCRSEYPPLVSFGLWIMTELAIIGSDIQEVLGSAVAFELLFGLPLWLGCLLTGLDTFTFLALHKAGDSKTRYLEMFFLLLIATINPISSLYGRDIQTSCIPAKAALSSGSAIYDAFTGNVCVFGGESVFEGNVTTAIMNTVSKCTPCYVDGRGESFGTELFESGPTAGYCQEIGLAEAGEAIREALGGYAKVVWAIGLLASGQASTMTGTYAGQFVMEGFLDIRIAAWKRVALTRGVALIPAIIVALISQDRQFQSDRFNELLNVLQSVQLPFALLPLLAFTTSKRLMGPHFVNTRWIAALLVVGTALLCGVNYTLVYDILLKNLPEKLSASAWISLVTIAGLYVTLLLYLLLIYPSETVPPHYVVLPSAVSSELPREEKNKSAGSAEEPLLENEGVYSAAS
ncbi:Phosphatidylinositide phosphatase SAC1-B [Phytophthora nicotianae]|uniref:Phosphatidylinositide phosphatase SAC1-B n=1 Tax=Phytophthora nicotianae TaxID=4792 RepID=A0A0W8DKP0_PHYNI|nr:Phosphatidylinositide phosphatase SAC1-B [Phytophthora nicotianae]